MTRMEFNQLCGELCINFDIALDIEEVQNALSDNLSYEEVKKIINENI